MKIGHHLVGWGIRRAGSLETRRYPRESLKCVVVLEELRFDRVKKILRRPDRLRKQVTSPLP